MKHRVRFSWARRPDSSRTGRTGPDGGKRYHDHRRHDHFWLAGLAGPGSAGGPRTDRARRHPGRAGPSLSREGAALRPAPCSTPGRPSQIGAQTLCSARRRVRDSCDGYRGPRVAGVGMGRGRPSRIGASARRCPFRFAWRSESVSRPVPLAALQVNARTHARARTRIFKCTHFLALRSVSCGALQALRHHHYWRAGLAGPAAGAQGTGTSHPLRRTPHRPTHRPGQLAPARPHACTRWNCPARRGARSRANGRTPARARVRTRIHAHAWARASADARATSLADARVPARAPTRQHARVGRVAGGRRPAPRDPRPRAKSATRDPRPRATRASRSGPDMPGPARTYPARPGNFSESGF